MYFVYNNKCLHVVCLIKLIEINNHFIFSFSFSGVAFDVDRRRAEDVCCERL